MGSACDNRTLHQQGWMPRRVLVLPPCVCFSVENVDIQFYLDLGILVLLLCCLLQLIESPKGYFVEVIVWAL